jgi:hypothetical protein
MGRAILLTYLLLLPFLSVALERTDTVSYDTAYFENYPDLLTTRLYFSRKYTGFHVAFPALDGVVLKYAPNTTRNLGIGASYEWATLNLAYGFGFMNPDRGEGDTRYLDLQAHQYLGNFNIDFYGQFYQGYYLKNDEVTDDIGSPYVRPDIRVNEFGLTVQYVLNHRKLSMRAAFINNSIQKKSAGSFIFGMDIFYGKVTADSTLIPYTFEIEPSQEYDQMNFFKLGPNLGYAFTLVFAKHFFFTGSLVAALNGGYYDLTAAEVKNRQGFFSADLNVRTALGYNNSRFTLSAFFVNQRVQFTSNYRNILNVGNFRVIATYRLNAPGFLKKSKLLNPR